MLADDRLFDSPVYAPEMQKRLDRYEELVAKGPSARNGVEIEELASLAKDIDAQPLPPAVDDKLRAALDQIGAATPG
jgi:hypothetical protein